LYCETVIGTQNKLVVPDALESSVWSINNPDINLNMISYLGLPLNWPDGEVFGTVCFLDNKKNYYNKDYEDLLKQIKEHIENDLELMLLNVDLESKNEKLEQLNNIKTRFISLISHDIRGNVGTLDTFLQAISSDFDRYDESYLKKSLASLSQLASDSYNTLENLLKWSKNDLVDLEPEIESINVIDIVEQILSFFKYLLTLKNINVTKQFYSENAIIDTDKNMLTVILRNIISNAIKFSDRNGAIHIAVNHDNDKHTILIKDSGVGMSESTIGKLFSYTKEHSKGTLDESSAGIGLMLTKEFADKIGAKILVESKHCEGTSFSLII
jgi:signal transduction histidine kinase